MFQSAKDRRAREEELVKQQDMLEAMRQAVACVADGSNGVRDALEEMEENQKSLDGILKQAVSMIHKVQEDKSSQDQEEAWIRQQLEEFCRRLQKREEAFGQSLEHTEEQQQTIRKLAEHCQDGAGAVQSLREWTDQLGSRLEQALEQAKAMDAQGRSMSVLSLNAAIDAGRMGESGRKFVMALEEVQGCAGEYRKAAELLEQELFSMQKGLGEAQERLNQLEELQERNRQDTEAVRQKLDESLEQLKGSGQVPGERKTEGEGQETESGSLEELYRRWEQAACGNAGQEEVCGQILRQMEAAGESRRREQQLLEQLRVRQEQIRDAIKERTEWE